MQKDEQYIEWKQCALVEKQTSMASTSHGISLVQVKLEHVKLNSFAKMRVDLAAQVRIYLLVL